MLLSYSLIPFVKRRTFLILQGKFYFTCFFIPNVDEQVAGYLLTDIEYFLCQLAKLKMNLCLLPLPQFWVLFPTAQ